MPGVHARASRRYASRRALLLAPMQEDRMRAPQPRATQSQAAGCRVHPLHVQLYHDATQTFLLNDLLHRVA